MFLKIKGLKRMMKDAYNNGCGLYVGKFNDRYYIDGLWWCAEIRSGFVPKEIKAMMMELCGTIPSEGEGMRCWKKEQPQMELNSWDDLAGRAELAEYQTVTTHTMVDLGERTGCLMEISGIGVKMMDSRIIDMIGGLSEADNQNGETEPDAAVSDSKMVYWKNNVCTLAASLIVTQKEDLASWLMKLKNIGAY